MGGTEGVSPHRVNCDRNKELEAHEKLEIAVGLTLEDLLLIFQL